MAKVQTITLEVRSSKFFDLCAANGSLCDLCPIGNRLSVPFMTGERPSFADALGLALYGIVVKSIETRDAAPGETIADNAAPGEASS